MTLTDHPHINDVSFNANVKHGVVSTIVVIETDLPTSAFEKGYDEKAIADLADVAVEFFKKHPISIDSIEFIHT